MNGDMPHDGGHGGGGHAVGEELTKTGKYESLDRTILIVVSYKAGQLHLFTYLKTLHDH